VSTWDDELYLQFAEYRTRAAADLLSRIPLERAARVLDLGCGPGNSTELLLERWPESWVIGVDSSPEMLARATAAVPRARFVRADLRHYRVEQKVDVLFSNAVLQWLDDHEHLVPHLYHQVGRGGTMAFQVSQTPREPTHQLMVKVAAEYGVADVPGVQDVGEPEFYYDLLAGRSQSVEIWQTRYFHVMPDASAIVRWVAGSGLRPYLNALPENQQEQFLADYTNAVDRAYPPMADGSRLLAVPRLFVVATRP
jgi:trans-aconitate 2-methyltransferase